MQPEVFVTQRAADYCYQTARADDRAYLWRVIYAPSDGSGKRITMAQGVCFTRARAITKAKRQLRAIIGGRCGQNISSTAAG